jgi:hypothetical protein
MGLKMSLKDAALVRVNLFLDDRETLSQYSTSFSKDSITEGKTEFFEMLKLYCLNKRLTIKRG